MSRSSFAYITCFNRGMRNCSNPIQPYNDYICIYYIYISPIDATVSAYLWRHIQYSSITRTMGSVLLLWAPIRCWRDSPFCSKRALHASYYHVLHMTYMGSIDCSDFTARFCNSSQYPLGCSMLSDMSPCNLGF